MRCRVPQRRTSVDCSPSYARKWWRIGRDKDLEGLRVLRALCIVHVSLARQQLEFTAGSSFSTKLHFCRSVIQFTCHCQARSGLFSAHIARNQCDWSLRCTLLLQELIVTWSKLPEVGASTLPRAIGTLLNLLFQFITGMLVSGIL